MWTRPEFPQHAWDVGPRAEFVPPGDKIVGGGRGKAWGLRCGEGDEGWIGGIGALGEGNTQVVGAPGTAEGVGGGAGVPESPAVEEAG